MTIQPLSRTKKVVMKQEEAKMDVRLFWVRPGMGPPPGREKVQQGKHHISVGPR